MTGQELATAVRYQLNLVVIVANNAMYGTIRMHQERRYPERVHGTGLVNPDFARLAESYGASGARAESNAEFDKAFDVALATTGPSLIEVIVDPDALSPAATLTQVRESALRRAADAS